jgi:hypothetical protein
MQLYGGSTMYGQVLGEKLCHFEPILAVYRCSSLHTWVTKVDFWIKEAGKKVVKTVHPGVHKFL